MQLGRLEILHDGRPWAFRVYRTGFSPSLWYAYVGPFIVWWWRAGGAR